MARERLAKDPFNIVITGVGGQGNVMASRVLANMLAAAGYRITIGETFGASQRGGSVMSHIRVSRSSVWSPQIPCGGADVVVSLEPIEALRVLPAYGNPQVRVRPTPARSIPSASLPANRSIRGRKRSKRRLRACARGCGWWTRRNGRWPWGTQFSPISS